MANPFKSVPLPESGDSFVDNPLIGNALQPLLAYTAGYLGATMELDITSSSLPRTVLAASPSYNSVRKIVSLPPTDLQFPKMRTLAHEVTHFLHTILQPDLPNRYGTDGEISNLMELVAYYGENVFSAYDHPSMSEMRWQALEATCKLSDSDLEKLAPGDLTADDAVYEYEIHEGGYRAASFLASKFSDNYLGEFARADVSQATELLRRLGYHGELFIPYARVDALSVERREVAQKSITVMEIQR